MQLSTAIKKKLRRGKAVGLQPTVALPEFSQSATATPGKMSPPARKSHKRRLTRFSIPILPSSPLQSRRSLLGCSSIGDQFDALVSLSYNIGSLTVKAPTLVRKVKSDPNDPTIRAEFMKHVNARVNGVLKPLPGLMKRRAAEADHYFGKI